LIRVAIIDYGSGNLRSAQKAFERAAAARSVSAEIFLASDPEQLRHSDRIVLPGVGAFKDCRDGIYAVSGLREALELEVRRNAKPFLGICVGMQLLATKGLEFGETIGLDWVGGIVRRIQPSFSTLKVPHVGWNELNFSRGHPLLDGLEVASHAYFVHSFEFIPAHASYVIATTDYGGAITAAIVRDNIAGTQFHPEKSQALGLNFIGNFLEWRP
jgi:glutamine amidotransferase